MKKYLEMLLKAIDLNKLIAGFASGDKKPLQVVFGSIDVNQIASVVLDDLIDEALDKVVNDTTNPFDNTAKQMLYPPLVKHLKILIAEKIEKMQAESPEIVAEAGAAVAQSLREGSGEKISAPTQGK